MSFSHTYNADPFSSGMFGNGWSFSYDENINIFDEYPMIFGAGAWSVQPVKTVAMVNRGTGRSVRFSLPSSDNTPPADPVVFKPEGDHFDKLIKEPAGSWIYEPKGSHTQYKFDSIVPPLVHLTRITDTNGNMVQIERNTDATIKSITDAAGRITHFSYASFGGAPRCILMTTPDGRTASYDYDSNGNLIQSTDLLGSISTYTYDSYNFLTSLSVADAVTSFVYTGDGFNKKISAITDAEGYTINYVKNSLSPVTTVTDARGSTFTYEARSDSPKGTTLVIDPLGGRASTTYGSVGPTDIADQWGYHKSLEYDTRGNPTRTERPHAHINTYSYDADDNLLTSTDALGNTWTYQYDANHNLTRQTSPMGRETILTYTTQGLLSSHTDPGGQITSYSYDSFGNILTITDPLLNVTSFEYDADGLHLISKTDPQNRTTSYSYDNNDRLTRVRHADNSSVQYSYDEVALISRTNEAGVTFQTQHNKLLATTQIYDAMGNYTAYGYDQAGNMITHRDPLGNTRSYTYDKNSRLTSETTPLLFKNSWTYDYRGMPTGFTDERNNTSTFLYDGNQFIMEALDPFYNGPRFTYDTVGRLSSRASSYFSPRSNTTQTYNDDGLLYQIFHDGILAGTYSYDAAGNMTAFNDASGTTSYGYNALRQVTSISYPDNLDVNFFLYPDGLPDLIRYPNSLDVAYTYDERQRVTAISWSGDSSLPGGNISMSHDVAGRVTAINRSNGTNSSYTYDVNGRVTGISHSRQSTSFASMTYSRDKAGNVIQATLDVPVDITQERSNIDATFNAANQLAAFNNGIANYDVDGNLTAINGDREFLAFYDAENRLSTLTTASSNSRFSFNLPGQRTRIEKNSTVRNIYPDHRNRVLFETDSEHTVTALYIYSGDRPMVMLRNGESYFYHYDQQGSVTALTDTSGQVAAAYMYSPFGTVIGQSGNIENPFTWNGGSGVMDDGDGIYYMTNRHYDAISGRFLQKDPAGLIDTHNLYTYAQNNPLNRSDPLGLNWKGSTAAVGNMTLGIALFGLKGMAAITAPTWGGVAVCGISAGLGIARLYSVYSNPQNYQTPDYDYSDGMADFLDPTRFVRDKVFPAIGSIPSSLEGSASWWLDAPSNDTDYGSMKSSTYDISFPEFTLD